MFQSSVGRRAVLYLCRGGIAAPAQGQTLPLPVIPVPPPPPPAAATTAPPAEGSSQAVLRQWEYLFEVGTGYNSNVFFLPEGPADTVFTPRAQITHASRGPTSEGRIEASGRAVAYLEQRDEVAIDAALTASGRQETSARTTVSGLVSGGLGHTDESVLLQEQGVLLPFSQTRFARAEAAVLWKTSARTTLELRGRGYYDDYVAPELVDSRSLRGSLKLGRLLSEHSALSAEYSVERIRSDGTYTTQFASLQLDHRMSTRSGFLAEGGASYTDYSASPSGRPSAWNFYGGFSIARIVGPSSTALFVRREVIPAFGLGGVELTDRIGLRTSFRLGQSWGLSAEGIYVQRSDSAQDVAERSDSEEGRLTALKRIGRRLELGTELQYRRYAAPAPRPPIEQFEAQLTVGVLNPRASVPRP